jgi:hypothetical protein
MVLALDDGEEAKEKLNKLAMADETSPAGTI